MTCIAELLGLSDVPCGERSYGLWLVQRDILNISIHFGGGVQHEGLIMLEMSVKAVEHLKPLAMALLLFKFVFLFRAKVTRIDVAL